MTVRLTELVQYLEEYLEDQGGKDYGPNGLQVEGRAEIRKLVTGVSACQELFVRASELGADAVVVHHGLFWYGMPYSLTGLQYRRVAELIRSGVSLLAYHLPLDRHPGVGNNAVAARLLELEQLQPFGQYEGLPLGFRGRWPEPKSAQELVERCRQIFAQEPLAFTEGPPLVETVGVISGGAQREFRLAVKEGLDAYITGEASEWVMNVARESRTHFLAAGHYATERLGIRALGEHLSERFGLEVEFVDIPNPV